MRTLLSLSCAAILTAALATAQSPLTQNQQLTSGVAGVTPGQTARLNVLYPTVPAPILLAVCEATLLIADDQGNVLKTNSVSSFTAGKSVSLDLNIDTDPTGSPKTEIHGDVVSPLGCNFIATLELIDNLTQKTILVVGSKRTYPFAKDPGPSPAESPGPALSQPQGAQQRL